MNSSNHLMRLKNSQIESFAVQFHFESVKYLKLKFIARLN